MRYKVFIFSYHSMIQVGLSFCVKKSFSNASVFKTNSLEQFFKEGPIFDLYILDISQFIELEYISELIKLYLKEKKIVVFGNNNNIEKLLELKDIVYINENRSELEVVKQLRLLCKKRKYVIKYRKAEKQHFIKDNTLSERELQCAKLLMKGYSVTQISKELSLAMNTVSTYKKRIHNKTKTKNVVQLIKTLYTFK